MHYNSFNSLRFILRDVLCNMVVNLPFVLVLTRLFVDKIIKCDSSRKLLNSTSPCTCSVCEVIISFNVFFFVLNVDTIENRKVKLLTKQELKFTVTNYHRRLDFFCW